MSKALRQSYNVNSANQPKLGAQMNLLTLHEALMVPKCLRRKSQPKGIFPLTTFHKVKWLFLGTPHIFWEKTLFSLISKHIIDGQSSIDKEPLPPTSLLPLCFCGFGRIVKSSLLREGMNLGRGNDNCSRPHTLSELIRSFVFKWRHLQSWLITPYSGVNPQTTALLISNWGWNRRKFIMVDIWCRDHWPQSSVSTIFISTSAFKMQTSHNPLEGTKCLLSEGQQGPGLWESRT